MWTLPAFWGASGFVPWSMQLLVSTSTETSKQHHFIMGGGQHSSVLAAAPGLAFCAAQQKTTDLAAEHSTPSMVSQFSGSGVWAQLHWSSARGSHTFAIDWAAILPGGLSENDLLSSCKLPAGVTSWQLLMEGTGFLTVGRPWI